MRVQTLKSYTRNNLEKYLDSYSTKTKSLSNLLELSKKDNRVAELSQAYFNAEFEFKKGNMFFVYTGEKFLSKNEFLSSNTKYLDLFNRKKMASKGVKNLYREKLEVKRKEKNLSYYKFAKLLKTPQSNVDCFFKKNDDHKLSQKALGELMLLLK